MGFNVPPCSCKLLDVKQAQNKEGKTILYFVFEYMDTNLKKFIRSHRSTGQDIPSKTVKCLMYQLCKGMDVCHGHGALHKYYSFSDLKPHNLLMDPKTMMLKIADLELARAFTVSASCCSSCYCCYRPCSSCYYSCCSGCNLY